MLLVVVSGIASIVRNSIVERTDKIYKQNTVAIAEMGVINTSIEKIRGDIYHYIAVPAERNKTAQSFNEIISSVNDSMQAYKNRNIGADEKKIIIDFDAAWPEMQRGYKAIMKAADEKENDEVNHLLADQSYVTEALKKTFTAINGLNEINRKNAEEANNANSAAAKNASLTMWIVTGSASLLAMVVGILFAMSFIGPFKQGVIMMQELEKGHLSTRLNMDRKDEIGDLARAMDKFADHLQKNVISNIQKISEGDMDINTTIFDDKDEFGPALKRMTDTIKYLVVEMNVLTQSAMEGKLDVRGDAHDLKGAYQEIIQGVNKTLDAVTGPINEASETLEKIAGKDMTARMKGDYKGEHAKIKESLNLAVENLDKALQQVAIGADQVGSASVQVSTGGQSLSQGASEQASSLEEVSSSLQEMSSMTKQNAINAREAKGVAEAARDSADKGVESMSRMSSAINKIKTSSDSTAKIVKTIDEIAFQTNLLALNAAVEAARAGDAGKGFAVVAEEVRNLAMRSAEAAKNTANLIEEAVKNSENGVVINSEVLKNFHEITERINKVSQVVAEIAAASDQQDQGISQLNKAVEQLNHLTQQNAANAEESASAAEEMSSQSEEMRSMVAGFMLTGHWDKTRAAIPVAGRQQHIQAGLLKGQKTIRDIAPQPRHIIPLDESDHDVLTRF
jgi:methyl-accepting chemotaxis protein